MTATDRTQAQNRATRGRRRGSARQRRDKAGTLGHSPRTRHYRQLVNPLLHQPAFSDDRVAAIHETALRVLEELGIKVLHAGAREHFRKAGAAVDESSLMVRLDRGLIAQALESAPGLVELQGATPDRRVLLGGKHLAFTAVGGPPHITDIDRGKRNGSLEDHRNLIKLSQHFDVIHMQQVNVEAQDLPTHLRHLRVSESQLSLSDKPIFIFSRGTPQVRDCFHLVRLARGLDAERFAQAPYCYTVINTNSPRQLDIPMCQGIIDFAAAGQLAVITPFTLSGAMAPVTIAGALTLQHAEALAGIALSQIVRPGAPVVYGSFTSNVDMKSGAPAFGTPEFVKGAFGAGQLARHIGLPWRGSAATASNAPDEQAVYEFLMSAWGSLLGGVNLMLHSAGWLEGGLTASMEKFILDVEMLQILAEALDPLNASDEEIGFDAIAEVAPGGHFFAAQHTMQRYQSAFYEPLVSDWRNFGQWSEDGAKTATQRANQLWKSILRDFEPPPMDPARLEAMRDFVTRRTSEGGAPPES
ncbi:trimethylamine methyltransferase family protein [Pelagibius sp.]|uniref:trimethylamine methyltransferase family protein n=1 Tax=Pelagibius sp. TaxID=1931238 RepID=UPI00260D2266|nr:trimethylamine methyltransferase family protein [Pelagibius sp.]